MSRGKSENFASRGLQPEQAPSDDLRLAWLMQKLVTYIKLANYDSIRNRLMEIVNSDDKKRAFEATDGINSTRDIYSITGVNKNTVSAWWNDWEKQGLVEESTGARGRRVKLVSLSDFGIGVPAGKRQRAKVNKAQKEQ